MPPNAGTRMMMMISHARFGGPRVWPASARRPSQGDLEPDSPADKEQGGSAPGHHDQRRTAVRSSSALRDLEPTDHTFVNNSVFANGG